MNKNKREELEKIMQNVIEKNMVDIMSDRFGKYSKYIIQQRAIPDSRDGLKPVQRRILYAMWNLKLKNKEPFKKSARIVGDVIGRYHPHGDSSVYEALVRMCQEWKSNYPLIEMHGNKGSIDDDPAAAMRYTESRLEKISELMLKDLDRNVVPLAPNFDDSEYEPIVLPSLFPNLLINGAKGIAAGFATEIPPHNLNEIIDAIIQLIKEPTTKIEELLQIVKGPDFPTGGIVHGLSGIEDALRTGQGKIWLSSKYNFVYNKSNKITAIEITEIPFGVVKSKLVADIDTIAIDKVIAGIKEVRDESDRNGISIMLELEEDSNPQAIITYLMNKTDLRISYNYNMVAIDNNAPCLLTLESALITYLQHLKAVNTNGIKYDLQKYKLRHEIVEGFIKVAEISDKVIKVIKDSDNSKKGVIAALMAHFEFSEIQATAIAELRLYKLSRMDQIEFQEEKLELEKNIARCNLLLNDSREFDKFIISQLNEIKKEYGAARKTEISLDKLKTEVDHKLLTKNEDFYFFISQQGYIKKISLKMFNSNEFSTYKLKENDSLQYYDKINSLSKLIFFTNLGNFFIIEAHSLRDNSWKELGDHISSYNSLESDERIIRVMEITSFDSYIEIVLISKYGFGKKVKISEFNNKLISKKRTCMAFKNLDDELIDAKIGNGEKDIFVLLNNGCYYLINESIFNSSLALKAQGIKLFPKLQTKDKVFVSAFATTLVINSVILLTESGYAKQWNMREIPTVQRWGRGSKLFNILKNVNLTPTSFEVKTTNLELFYTNKSNELMQLELEDLKKDRTKGDKLIKLTYDFENSGSLIQHIKINELKDPDLESQLEISNEFLRQKESDKDYSLTVETSLLKRYYQLPVKQEDKEYQDIEQVTLFDPDFVEADIENNEKSQINERKESKLTFKEKMQALDEINVDDLLEKVKQIKKK
ncbi:DNA topoisomerase (ATP-hydrolyzing) [Metamycoplasma equirhinis]|uniref:DNA topoisomerase (ATP-hydrolyzing) n=1 Tax=Metamycoplasma equirhinis TaxID=92402 RepID=A0ABZ0PAN3_9BACT|nr:DNA topoisomerase (ATP-hydrolyzing) [Metamycoplasma equirhinis]TPD99405.1 DNA topoisomerase 4 subunit A [Metamycoplasma equirhinis]WPB53851.1 DNA topoisomerase (ATP-hydrolyzing) [Metamycoplasma equirhinis]